VLSSEALVKDAVEMGISTLALTNINSTTDHWDFLELCRQEGIQAILGAEIRNDEQFLYVLLARNMEGVREINAFITFYKQSGEPFPARPECSEAVWIIYRLGKMDAARLRSHELIGVKATEVNKLFGARLEAGKYVVLQPVTFRDKKGHNLHRLLRAIHKNIVLSRQEDRDIASVSEVWMPPATLLQQFRQYPAIVMNTLKVAESCQYDIDFSTDKNKKTFSASVIDDKILLEKLALEGMVYRFGKSNRLARQRVLKELEIINKLNFNAYFLITWDLIRYAQSRGFYHVGRGSGANSIVAYCLQITDVNPIELDLYFERFLNPFRATPPDFDIDFSWKDRDEVIDYVFKRYGKEHVALLGMYSTFQFNASVRELAKVFGLPKAEVDALLRNPKAGFNEDKIQQQILHYAAMMENLPNYLSIHPGGMLISQEPIAQYTALELPPKGFSTTQIDMFVAEKIGLYKLDILSQRGLGHIKEAISIIRENKGISVDIHAIEDFKKDPAVASQIRNADTIGCFYIESPAMRHLLKKLRCDDYITLVAASSIIRPGVAQSGMMREYIYRFHHPDSFQYIHPKMAELLQETYGVMVYQEDVIKVAHHFAGLDLAEADVLRRAMSGKYRGRKEMDRIRDQFFVNCKERNYPDEIAAEVWRQMESFSGYSFSKAHSASFAVESYQSLYLKTYYPMEFMVAVINNFGGFYSRELYFHELKKTGALLHAPCVNRSEELTHIRGIDVYLGFIHIQNLEKETIIRTLEERARGLYASLQDYIQRTGIGIEQINILVRIGAFAFTGKTKKQLLWEANFLQKKTRQALPSGAELFRTLEVAFDLPDLPQEPYEDRYDQIELLGFTLEDPFSLADTDLSGYVTANRLQEHVGAMVDVLGYYITYKNVRTKNGAYMFFGTFLDAHGDWIDSVHFPDSANRHLLEGPGFYHLRGKVTEEFGVHTIEVQWMKKIGLKHDA
jgi:DNA polymerase-3 subunit alpha